MPAKLKTERNTRAIEDRIIAAAHERFPRRHRLAADFEHGQWWLTDCDTGRQWSVVDAQGGSAVDGFDFELVTEGDEEC